MEINDVSEMMKQIGPYVSHSTIDIENHTVHLWTIGVSEFGISSALATLMIASEHGSQPDLEGQDWQKIIEDGKGRYEQAITSAR